MTTSTKTMLTMLFIGAAISKNTNNLRL